MTICSDTLIVPIEPGHIGGFHSALDLVARERRYRTLLEAPPLQQTRDFVLNTIKNGDPRFVVLARLSWSELASA